MKCLICDKEMLGPHRGYWFKCRQCGFLASNLSAEIGNHASHDTINEDFRREALDAIRHDNFSRILDELQRLHTTESATLLDVGCAHGWFLQAATRRGYSATGLEPDSTIAAVARQEGLSVIPGYFPDDLPPRESFGVITFLDVFEHLPSPHEAAAACFERLAPEGLLVMTLPSSKGILYRIARLLSRLGIHGPLDRLWQRGFPSPHISYFHPAILANMLEPHGFREVHRGTFPSFRRKGLWKRLRYDRRSSLLTSIAQWLVLITLSPLLFICPSDISLQIFRRVGSSTPPAGKPSL